MGVVFQAGGCLIQPAGLEETEQAIREAIELHREGLREDDDPIPEPTMRVGHIVVAACNIGRGE